MDERLHGPPVHHGLLGTVDYGQLEGEAHFVAIHMAGEAVHRLVVVVVGVDTEVPELGHGLILPYATASPYRNASPTCG